MTAIALLIATLFVGEPPPPLREFRGAWVATVDNIDWPSSRTLTAPEQQAELVRVFDKAAELKLNAIVFQVRPSADALYQSSLEPWSEFLTGRQGAAPKPAWDPLKEAVKLAHDRGIELHAWINPYRAWHPAHKGEPAGSHVRLAHPEWIVPYGNQIWIDPGILEAENHSLRVALDIVKRYDIDGLQIDDYFYPYRAKKNGQWLPFPDDKSYKRYKTAGGKLDRDDWRRSNTDRFVETLYREVKRAKPWVKVGISPFGIYRPGVPEGIEAGIDQYGDLYADPVKWLAKGWCDYLSPQLYWPIDQRPQSYKTLLSWWVAQNTKSRHLWIGNFTSRLGVAPVWPRKEILKQIDMTRGQLGATGNIHFSFKALQKNYDGIADALIAGPYREVALVPASPWLDSRPPGEPKATLTANVLKIAQPSAESLRGYALYERQGGSWLLNRVLPPTASQVMIVHGTAVALSALDRAGNESKRLVLAP